MPQLKIRIVEFAGDFGSAAEAAETVAHLLGVFQPGQIAPAPALRNPPNEYTTAEETAAALPPAPHAKRKNGQPPPSARPFRLATPPAGQPRPITPDAGAEPKQEMPTAPPARGAAMPKQEMLTELDKRVRESWKDDPEEPERQPMGFGQAIIAALAAAKRPMTVDQIWAWCQKNGAAHLTKQQAAGNLYPLRQQGKVLRTPGSEGMGAGITWELRK